NSCNIWLKILDTRATAVVLLSTVHVFSTQTVAEFYCRRSNLNLDKTARRQNLFELEYLQLGVESVFVAAAFGRFNDHLNRMVSLLSGSKRVGSARELCRRPFFTAHPFRACTTNQHSDTRSAKSIRQSS
ncbi:MAG TPA: hypothetical protein VIY69_12740, partial [Candidatus Acidoferrales bacterium]